MCLVVVRRATSCQPDVVLVFLQKLNMGDRGIMDAKLTKEWTVLDC